MKKFYDEPEFKRLQRRWYAKVKKSGHKDIERFQDLNKFPASTLKGKGASHGAVSFVSTNWENSSITSQDFAPDFDATDIILEKHSMTDIQVASPSFTPKGELWRAIGIIANEWIDRKEKEILLDISQFGRIRKKMLKEKKVSRDYAKKLFHRMLAENGIDTVNVLQGSGAGDG